MQRTCNKAICGRGQHTVKKNTARTSQRNVWNMDAGWRQGGGTWTQGGGRAKGGLYSEPFHGRPRYQALSLLTISTRRHLRPSYGTIEILNHASAVVQAFAASDCCGCCDPTLCCSCTEPTITQHATDVGVIVACVSLVLQHPMPFSFCCKML